MSNIIVNPGHKAENSVYLLFSGLFATFVFYVAQLREGGSTGPGFVPNPLGILAVSSFFTALLVYTKPDESLFHSYLKRKTAPCGKETCRFLLLGSYLLHTYVLMPRRVRSPDRDFSDARSNVLKGGDLDGEIWKLRGALWFLLSVPLSLFIIACAADDAVFILADTIGAAACISVFVKASRSLDDIVSWLTALSEFEWFDSALTAVKRSETTAELEKTEIKCNVQGVSESLYRSLVGMKEAKTTDRTSVPQVIRPLQVSDWGGVHAEESPIYIRGSLERVGQVERQARRRTNEILHSECEWLRELARRRNWVSFLAKFGDLKASVIQKGCEQLPEALGRLLATWGASLSQGRALDDFSHFRSLLHLLDKGSLLDSIPRVDIVRALLKYDKSLMADRSWSFKYYLQEISPHQENTDDLDRMFYKTAEEVLDQYASEWGPPVAEEPIDIQVEMLERRYESEYGFQMRVYPDMPDDKFKESLSDKMQDYSSLDK